MVLGILLVSGLLEAVVMVDVLSQKNKSDENVEWSCHRAQY